MKTISRRGFLSSAVAAATCAVRADAKPYTGRTLVVVTAHADDFTIFAGGAIIKMIDEGYTAHLIRVTNDEKDSYDLDVGETSRPNTAEMRAAADIIGIKDIYSLDFRNDEMDPVPETEVRARVDVFDADDVGGRAHLGG